MSETLFSIVLDVLAALAIPCGGLVIGWLAKLFLATKWVKELKLENFILTQAEVAIRFVENWAKGRLSNSSEKLQKATEVLKESLKTRNVKITNEDAEKYIEAVINKLKAENSLYERKSTK